MGDNSLLLVPTDQDAKATVRTRDYSYVNLTEVLRDAELYAKGMFGCAVSAARQIQSRPAAAARQFA